MCWPAAGLSTRVYKAAEPSTEPKCRVGEILYKKGGQEIRDTRQGFYIMFSDSHDKICIRNIWNT